MGKNVQIPLELWNSICQFHLQYDELEDWERQEICDAIEHGIRMKLESQQRRESYTQYKTAASPDQREAARQQYLDQRGVPGSHRWSQQYEEQRKK